MTQWYVHWSGDNNCFNCVNYRCLQQVLGYRLNRIKFALTWLAILATAGLLRLIFFWKPSWMLYCTHDCCQTEFATKLLLKVRPLVAKLSCLHT